MHTLPEHFPPPPNAESEPPLGYVLVPPVQPPGLNVAISSVVVGLAAPFFLFITLPLGLFAAMATRSPTSSGPRWWVAPLVLWSLPTVCTMGALVLSAVSLWLARNRGPGGRRSKAWIIGGVGLGIVVVKSLIVVAWLMETRRFMILF